MPRADVLRDQHLPRQPALDQVADDVEALRVARHVACASAGSRTTRARRGRTRGSSRVSAISQQRLGSLDPEVEVVERAVRSRSAPASRSDSRISSAESSWRPTWTVIGAPVARCAAAAARQHLPLLGVQRIARRAALMIPALHRRCGPAPAPSPGRRSRPGGATRPPRSRRPCGRRRRPRSSRDLRRMRRGDVEAGRHHDVHARRCATSRASASGSRPIPGVETSTIVEPPAAL